MEPERIYSAYRQGIFPWFNEDNPILWWSPDPRHVIFPEIFKTPRSVKKIIRDGLFNLSVDTDFYGVITSCAKIKRKDQNGTWISNTMIDAYCYLHELGIAHSFETYQGGSLVGGLYGLCLGRTFAGESMFSRISDASKFAFNGLVSFSRIQGITMIDCQFANPFLLSLGSQDISRISYIKHLKENISHHIDNSAWKKFHTQIVLPSTKLH